MMFHTETRCWWRVGDVGVAANRRCNGVRDVDGVGDGRVIEAVARVEGAADGGPEKTMMDGRLLDAATSGDAVAMKHLALHDPTVLLGTTQQGNTCLHISSTHGH
ncbi:hypothetical protein C2845_PM18G03250 [Panicum miliaceum]|uniref:Ankyrin repeat-containing protein n=1 Tax=Panicum miliaceum TaxID=4540 RepID=A0A3L6PJP2_PANMI|nr:hypothetical protein C2845_PM18G03250 [Panicum miliaceum]